MPELVPNPWPEGEPQSQQVSTTPPPQPPGDLAAIARFPRNKISRLDPETRQSINQMLRQRIPYVQILQKLGDLGKTLNKNNLFRWKRSGYLIWLQEQQRREDARAQLQLLLDLARENDNGTIHQAAQQLATLKICYALADIDLAQLRQTFQQDPAAFLRLVQALPRLSQGGMNCERVQIQVAERKAELQKQQDPNRGAITQENLRKLELRLGLR